MAVEHLKKQRKRFSLTNRSWDNLNDLESYLKKEIKQTIKGGEFIPKTAIDTQYRAILFPKNEEATAQSRMPELIHNFKESVIQNWEHQQLSVERALKDHIHHGWQQEGKQMDFYELTCAFFRKELKDNPRLAAFIQTEYLNDINQTTTALNLQISDLQGILEDYYQQHKSIIDQLDDIQLSLNEIQQDLGTTLPQKTAQVVVDALNKG